MLKAYLAEMFYLSKELQSEDINWIDVQYEIEQVKQFISTIDNDKLCTEASIHCEKIGIPLNISELELPIHAQLARLLLTMLSVELEQRKQLKT